MKDNGDSIRAEKLLEENPESSEAYVNRGLAFLELNCYEDAVQSFRKAISCNHNDVCENVNTELVTSAINRLWDTVNALDNGQGSQPQDALMHDKCATALLELGAIFPSKEAADFYKVAIKAADKAIELSDGQLGHYNKACALARTNHHMAAFQKILKYKKQAGDKFDSALLWKEPHFEPLREHLWIDRFEAVVDSEINEPFINALNCYGG